MTEKLSKNLRIVIILMAIFGTILFPICCMLFANNVISAFGDLDALSFTPNPSHELFQSVADNAIIAMFQAWAILFSGFAALFGWVMVFIEYGSNKKYSVYSNAIPIIGGIICLIGINMPSSGNGFITVNSILFSIGGSAMLMGVLNKMGYLKRVDVVST
jgi:hypothetical protein